MTLIEENLKTNVIADSHCPADEGQLLVSPKVWSDIRNGKTFDLKLQILEPGKFPYATTLGLTIKVKKDDY